MKRCFILAIMLFVFDFQLSVAQDARKIAEVQDSLSAAVETYGVEETKAREVLILKIDQSIEKAKNNKRLPIERRLALIDELTTAKTAFQNNDSLPSTRSLKSSVRNYERTIASAKTKCIKAYKKASESFGNLGALEDAKRTLDELKTFQSSDVKKKQNKDLFEVGSTFLGTRVILDAQDRGKEIKYKLVVTEYKNRDFRATFSLNDNKTKDWLIQGRIRGNKISYQEIGGGKYRVNVIGVIDGNDISFDFRGRLHNGNERFGNGKMTFVDPKNDGK